MENLANLVPFSKMMISDMKINVDPSQYGNQEGISIQHYLVKFIDRVLSATDGDKKKKSVAVLATLVDWKEAFSRQCPKLGIESFIKNGVRPALIPLLINFFQGRQMKVKWHGELSEKRVLKGNVGNRWDFYLSLTDRCKNFDSRSSWV